MLAKLDRSDYLQQCLFVAIFVDSLRIGDMVVSDCLMELVVGDEISL